MTLDERRSSLVNTLLDIDAELCFSGDDDRLSLSRTALLCELAEVEAEAEWADSEDGRHTLVG